MTVRRPRALLFALCGPLLMLAHAASPKVERIVILKVDGLPQRLIEQYTRPSGRPERVRLPHIATIFGEHGASLDHFYSRGLSLSAPSWSLLDTGRHLEIHGNVEYDRYTLRPWDYLNFFPFYVGYALSRRVDMPGAEFLDQQGVPLLIDRFPYQQRYQSFQLLQRGIRWSTLHSSLQVGFVSRSLRDLFDEWQTGFSMSDSVNQATERDILRDLKNPQIRYLDYFTGEFDHVAHLTPDRAAQLHVLESLDALTGRLWSAIQSSPLAATTALVMVSDHGMNTDEQVYSQGYNLVDWFNSAAGGGHHVITDRHPMTEFKLKGLDPFVSEVITPSREATYLAGKSAEYPTVILDLDGNERANVALRDNALNIAQILLDQITQKKASGRMRGAAISALLELIDSKRAFWEARLAEMETERIALRQRIDEQQRLADKSPKRWTKAQRDKGLDKDARRIEDRIERYRQQERGNAEYIAAMRRLLSLTDADFDTKVAREPNDRAKASEMEHAIRAHIRENLDQDPVAYRKLSERLKEVLEKLGEQWDLLAQALAGLVGEIRAGQVAEDERLPDLPEHYGPFLRLMIDAAVGDALLSESEQQKLVGLSIEVVDMVAAELTPTFWKPNRQPAQDALSSRVFELLMASRLLPTPQIEALTDKLMELARANHDKLMKA